MNEINYKEVLEDIAESQSLTVEKLVEETNKKRAIKKKNNDIFSYIPESSLDSVPTPNVLLRSSLFGVVKPGVRKIYNNYEIPAIGDIKIKITGQQLDQADFDLWTYFINLYKGKKVNEPIIMTKYAIVKALGKSDNKANYDWLDLSLKRFVSLLVEINGNNYKYYGHFIEKVWINDDGALVIYMDEQVSNFYINKEWTNIYPEIRLEFGKNQLAKWLYSFFSSHKKPYPHKIDTIHKLCGSSSELKEFKKYLTLSLKMLEDVTGWKTEIKNDLVYINRVLIKK